jgi:Sec-independent protein translocase protein TatA
VGDLLIVLIVILVLVLLWRGPKTLPRLGEALGRGVREARTQASEATSDSDQRRDGEATMSPPVSSSPDGDRRP